MSEDLQNLEKRIAELESLVASKNKSSQMFGRTYSEIGDPKQDFIINTRGQVKIKYGNKYIDLLKEDKLNVNLKPINSVDNIDNARKDGVYIDNDNNICIRYSGVNHKLVSESSGSLPIGTIIMFHSDTNIPDGWVVCDGQNGTPDLVGKYIKANSITALDSETILPDTQGASKNVYSVVFIMKIK